MINKIVNTLNSAYSGMRNNMILKSVAQSIIRSTGSVDEIIPGVINDHGEIEYVGIDSDYELIIYHKINSVNVTQLKGGTGDDFGDSITTFSMSMIVMNNKQRTSIDSDDLFITIQAFTPDALLNIENIKLCQIIITGAIFDSNKVKGSEYKIESDFKMPELLELIQINYNIIAQYNPRCFKKCFNC